MPRQPPIRVEGLRALSRAFDVADKTLVRELRSGLKDAAQPVATEAQGLAANRIQRIGLDWQQMRVGVTRSSVYVAPKRRNRGGSKRKNLASLLMDRSMQPALDRNVERVSSAVDDVLGTVGRAWESA